ncbi:MAG: NAD(P)H-binding protein [Pseudomonadota bacterium]
MGDTLQFPKTVLLAGATGTIGRAVAHELVKQGFQTVCLVRAGADISALPASAVIRQVDPTISESAVAREIKGLGVDAVISCMASRTGVPDDAWAVDHAANLAILNASVTAGAKRFIYLSAICVQKPELEFQHAKLAFEAELMARDLAWTIIRPTAFFKSLSGQVARVQEGKAFLVFGSGRDTACKPISDSDLARFIVNKLKEPESRGAIYPIGGPGPAIAPADQADYLFAKSGQPVRVKKVPFLLMDLIVGCLAFGSWFFPQLRAKSEFARIGRYYARESMLVWDAETKRYDAEATPSYGSDTLFEYYDRLITGEEDAERGEHAIF